MINDALIAPELAVSPDPVPGRRIVALGGGTGLSNLLRGLKHFCFTDEMYPLTEEQKECLTAIVTVSDDGGSSSILRKAYSILAPGDIRNCLLALSGGNATMKNLFGFRFNGDINDHSLGNLILTALSQLECDFIGAIEKASEILDVRGKVLPATLVNATIQAEFEDGSIIHGESNITAAGKAVKKVTLLPETGVTPLPHALKAIAHADLIVLGPGSLYTSIIPTLIVPGTAEAIARSKAKTLLIMNLMTEPGETDNYKPVDFLRALQRHVPEMTVDHVLMNNAPLPDCLLEKYRMQGSEPILPDPAGIDAYGCTSWFEDVAAYRPHIFHDPLKLAEAVSSILVKAPVW